MINWTKSYCKEYHKVVVGVGICDALSCGGGSCAVVCDTVALKGRGGGGNERGLIAFMSKVVVVCRWRHL